MRSLFCVFLLTATFGAVANVDCRGVPKRVYAGAHGPNSAGAKYWVVFNNWDIYLLGDVSNELAKARFAMAQAALVANKELELSFYSLTTCEQARTDKALPTAASLIN